jgi:ubiquitin-conjugating enzyme E2 C
VFARNDIAQVLVFGLDNNGLLFFSKIELRLRCKIKNTTFNMANTNVSSRLQTELLSLMTSPTPSISAFPTSTSLQHWTATLTGPPSTPYADLTFKLTMDFADTYPMTPPTVLFKTPIYHPNIDFSGRICLDILGKEKWSAVLNVRSVLISLGSLLGEPNVSSPLNAEAAELWEKDQDEYKRKVLARHKRPEELEELDAAEA